MSWLLTSAHLVITMGNTNLHQWSIIACCPWFSKANGVNSLWPNETIWWCRYGSTLTQIMAWCLVGCCTNIFQIVIVYIFPIRYISNMNFITTLYILSPPYNLVIKNHIWNNFRGACTSCAPPLNLPLMRALFQLLREDLTCYAFCHWLRMCPCDLRWVCISPCWPCKIQVPCWLGSTTLWELTSLVFIFLQVDEIKPLCNQRSSGRCWIFACMNCMRLPTAKLFNVEEFEFSQSYLFFWDKVEISYSSI